MKTKQFNHTLCPQRKKKKTHNNNKNTKCPCVRPFVFCHLVFRLLVRIFFVFSPFLPSPLLVFVVPSLLLSSCSCTCSSCCSFVFVLSVSFPYVWCTSFSLVAVLVVSLSFVSFVWFSSLAVSLSFCLFACFMHFNNAAHKSR